MAGIPTTLVTRDGFDTIVSNAFSGFGFPAEGPVTYLFPSEMFLEGSSMQPLEEHMEDMLAGLTQWKPQHEGLGITEVNTVDIEGKDYREVFEKCNNLFLRNQWGDDLPVIPPTEDMVSWIMKGTDLDADYKFGTVPPRGGVANVHSLAVCLAMAGGRPEYFPVFQACVEACIEPQSAMQSWSSTTNSVVPCCIVNGPVAKQIRLGHGYACLGPNAAFPAGQVIGRAIRILCMTLGGALPGTGDKAIFGGLSATNVVFAEDEDNVPEGWKLWSEERGYARGTNVVTQTLVNSKNNIYWEFGDEKANLETLYSVAGCMAVPNLTKYDKTLGVMKHDGTDKLNPDINSGLLILPPVFVQSIIDNNGFDQASLKQFLFDESKLPYELCKRMGYLGRINDYVLDEPAKPGDMIPFVQDPSQIHITYAGGVQGGHGYWMTGFCLGQTVSKEIKLPKNWDDLLLDAEIAMGPIPSE